jgi:TRAP-type mannitol/chloroaromatic compound transport system substrate-binding protein
MDRRKFVTKGAALATLGSLMGCGAKASSETNQSKKKHRWRMAMVVPKTLPLWGEGIQRFAELVKTLSDGRLDIRVYGAGELFPAMELFDKVREGRVQIGHGAAYYWRGKVPASVFFTSIPFGMNGNGMNAWIRNGGGQELWDELYNPLGVFAMPMGNTGVQFGGWFRKEIKSLEDFKGLKMRMPGLGGMVIGRAGAQEITLPGGDILTSLQTGVIDATEWIGPYHDTLMGFHKAADFYYTGGWHEPGSLLELLINKEAWSELDDTLRAIVKAAAAQIHLEMSNAWIAKDAMAFQELKLNPKIKLKTFPVELIQNLKEISDEIVEEIASTSPLARKVHDSFKEFQQVHQAYEDVSELAYASYLRP